MATHRRIPDLATAPPRTSSNARPLSEIVATLKHHNLIALLASTVLGAIAGGTSSALWAYMQPWFWGFDSHQIQVTLIAQLAAPVAADSALGALDPSRLGAGAAGSDRRVPAHGPRSAVPGDGRDRSLVVMTGALSASMVADVVDARAVAVGRREEGLVMATTSFVGKVASGVGVWIGGIVLTVIDFPGVGEVEAIDAGVKATSPATRLADRRRRPSRAPRRAGRCGRLVALRRIALRRPVRDALGDHARERVLSLARLGLSDRRRGRRSRLRR